MIISISNSSITRGEEPYFFFHFDILSGKVYKGWTPKYIMLRDNNKDGEKKMIGTGIETIVVAGGSIAFSVAWLAIQNPTKRM